MLPISDQRHAPRRRTGSRTSIVAACLAFACGPAWAAGSAISGKVEATPAKFLEETVVYLKQVAGTYPARTVPLDQKGKVFAPHVLVVTQGDTVEFLNHDTLAHNVFSPDNETYNLGTFQPNEQRTHTFKNVGVYTQLCSLHPEMLAYIFVGQNPYASVVDKVGHFTIKDVPPGTYDIEVWNSNLKTLPKKVTVAAGQTAEVSFALHR
jgi:plastocyanin